MRLLAWLRNSRERRTRPSVQVTVHAHGTLPGCVLAEHIREQVLAYDKRQGGH